MCLDPYSHLELPKTFLYSVSLMSISSGGDGGTKEFFMVSVFSGGSSTARLHRIEVHVLMSPYPCDPASGDSSFSRLRLCWPLASQNDFCRESLYFSDVSPHSTSAPFPNSS